MSIYAELHAYTCFSFLKCASTPNEIVAHAAAHGYRAIAITDECSVAGVVRALRERFFSRLLAGLHAYRSGPDTERMHRTLALTETLENVAAGAD